MKIKKDKLKILIVLPRGQAHKLNFGPITMSFREAPLTHTMLAALVPKVLQADVEIVDESVSKINFKKQYNLVGISVITGTALRAYELADIFRSNGSTVVLGGVHVTLLPEEAKQHADAIVVGFAEKVWPQLLYDFINGKLKKSYQGKNGDISNMPQPRRDLQKKFGYSVPSTLFATRGCRGNCDFCAVPAANFGWQKRPISQVIAEIKTLKPKRIVFNDVNLTDDPEYAKELFSAMISLKKIWGGLAQTRIGDDDELLDLMEKSGCGYILLGFESIDNQALKGMHKGFNKFQEYKQLVDKLHAHKICIQGCFIFGLDGEDKTVFSNTLDIIQELNIDIPRYALYTPFPKTDAYLRMKKAGRLLHENWRYYDTQHVVIVPDKMSPEELDSGFKWAYANTFTIKRIYRRTLQLKKNALIPFVGNLAYKMYVKKLKHDNDRFPSGIDATKCFNAATLKKRSSLRVNQAGC